MKKQVIIIGVLLLFLFQGTAASTDGVDFQIRYYDRSIYYTDSPVYIKVEITNNSTQTFRFKLSDARPFSLDFSVKTLQHEDLEHSDKYIMSKLTSRQVFFREISLEPGESYSFIENLADFIRIDQARQYRVQAMFYPELLSETKGTGMVSNTLSLTIRPGTGSDAIMAEIEEETGQILREEAFPPDQVVSYTIQARRRSQWEKFFLYLNLESLYLRNPGNAEKFRRASDEDRRIQLSVYREQLESSIIDRDLLVIPSEFRILKTTYTETQGTVDVLVKIMYPDFTELKQYTYQLERQRGIWKIINYDVRNLGTE